MMILTYVAAMVVLLGLCIFIHELGHLLGGKMVGIKARVFSMGYGKGVLKKKVGDTTYQVTLIPFGGYCQFYGENPTEDRKGESFEFLSAAPWRRIVTVVMGPLFNLFFGIIIFFAMNMIGYESETNRVLIPERLMSGEHMAAAAKAGMVSGDRIIRIDNREIADFEDIQARVLFSEGRALKVTVERGNEKKELTVTPKLMKRSGHYAMGIRPYGDKIVIAGVGHGDVAEASGLQGMDVVVNLDGKEIGNEQEFIDYIKPRAGKKIVMTILRRGEEKQVVITPRVNRLITINGNAIMDMDNLQKLVRTMALSRDGERVYSADNFIEFINKNKDKEVTLTYEKIKISGKINYDDRGYIGASPTINPHKVLIQYGIGKSAVQALVDPYDFIVMNLKGFGMIFSGQMSLRENLSGPIRIAQIAGDVAYYKGLSAFILLMAKISIILMVMNLLPIPAVDGSHLVFYLIEMIRRKPINQKIMERIQVAGVLILITIGVFVIINDISMLPAIQRLFN